MSQADLTELNNFRQPKEHLVIPEHALAQLGQYLGDAYNAISLDPLQNPAGLKISMGDDIRMSISPVAMSPHMEPLVMSPEPTRHEFQPVDNPTHKTIGITPTAETHLQQAALCTLQYSNLNLYADANVLIERFIDMLQRWAINGLPEETEREAAILQEFERLWNTVKNWEVYIPLVGLLIEGISNFEFGGVNFRTSKGIKAELMSPLETIILASNGIEEAKSSSLDNAQSFLDYFEHRPTVALVSMKGLQDSAVQMAMLAIELLLNMLRCYLPFVAPPDERAWFGTVGSLPQGKQMILALSEDKEGFNMNASRIGALTPLRVTNDVLTYLRSQCAWEQASKIAETPFAERSPLQSSIIAGSQWLGAAVITLDDGLCVHMCVTALEAFLATGMEPLTDDARCQQLSQLLCATFPVEQTKQNCTAIFDLRNHLFQYGPTRFGPEFRLIAERIAASTYIELCRKQEQFTTLAEYFEQQGQG